MSLILPNSYLKAQSESAPFQFQQWLQTGYGDWSGDPSLTFWVDPTGDGWEILQNTPRDGWRTVYTSKPGEKITVDIFRHLAENHWSRALENMDKAIAKQLKLDDAADNAKQERMEELARKVAFRIQKDR